MITCFKFKDIIDITYHSNTDTLYLSLSDSWLQENSLFKNNKDYMLEYEKRTTDNKEDLENNIVSVILKIFVISLVAMLNILLVISIRKSVFMTMTGIVSSAHALIAT